MSELTSAQLQAMEHITRYARTRQKEAKRVIDDILQMSNISRETYEEAVAKLKSRARIALHFHPDRPAPHHRSVAEALLEQGHYRSQFETGISSGSVSAYPGGARDVWEARMFGGAYQAEGVSNGQRPKYGALALWPHPDGPAPRFGSCYFLLSPKTAARSTYTYLDSHQDPKEKGTYAEFDDITAALLKDAFFEERAIGEKNTSPRKLIDQLLNGLEQPFQAAAAMKPSRNLNHYIEAQVHGTIDLQTDVDMLVADPSFKTAPTGRILEQLCFKYGITLYWHRGFAIRAEDVPADFRGPSMPSLARRIAVNGRVDASAIGAAALDLKSRPEAWLDRGCYEDAVQELKYMWHILVRYGDAAGRIGDQGSS
ncbi:DUF3626 domain-containing protein [Paenibacillus sp. GCM10023248]|uniref:DUF3626 domain-containing protein n=1 Tax=Bacillales TaxID=1385 RepID=UPI0028635E46|nr:hypothetical protein [Bacillus sp. 3255]